MATFQHLRIKLGNNRRPYYCQGNKQEICTRKNEKEKNTKRNTNRQTTTVGLRTNTLKKTKIMELTPLELIQSNKRLGFEKIKTVHGDHWAGKGYKNSFEAMEGMSRSLGNAKMGEPIFRPDGHVSYPYTGYDAVHNTYTKTVINEANLVVDSYPCKPPAP